MQGRGNPPFFIAPKSYPSPMPDSLLPSAALPRVVLDTNTVLALWLFEDPALAALNAAIARRRCVLLGREDAIGELRRVLAYPQFGRSSADQAALLAGYLARLDECVAVPASDESGPLPTCRDRDDQKFLEIAAALGATHLVTRDRALLRLARHRLVRERFAILTPEQFCALLQATPAR